MSANVTKLGIGLASATGRMEARTAFCLATAMQHVHTPMQLFLAIGCFVHYNRDTIARQAMESDCSHLLFIDGDVMFNHDAINQLIQRGVDIVGARYNKKILPLVSTVKEKLNGQMAEVPFVPTGFMLIDCDVFKKIGKPYFSFVDNAESEDMYFCVKAREHGFKVHCDPTIQIGHLGTAVF